jgi:hypothetical protein
LNVIFIATEVSHQSLRMFTPDAKVEAFRITMSFGKRPVLLAGALALISPRDGRYDLWEVTADRDGNQIALPCASAASGAIGPSHQLIGMDNFVIDYAREDGLWRASYCPPGVAREGLLSPNCRKLGFGRWPAAHEAVYLGLGRMLLWHRETLEYELHSAADRGLDLGNPLRNTSAASFFTYVGAGRLAGVDNRSALHHLKLPLRRAAGEASRHVHVVLELLAEGSYRVWNSEGWATSAFPRLGRSPLAGPVGRGTFPAASSAVAWTAAPTEPILLEVDVAQGTYRSLRVTVLDLDSLEPGTTTQPPLGLAVQLEGTLSSPASCGLAATRGACAALGGPCGWCEQIDGVHRSHCAAGGPARPCAAECATWHFFDSVPPVGPVGAPPPPPSPPGLTEADLVRLEVHSRAAAAWQAAHPAEAVAGGRRLAVELIERSSSAGKAVSGGHRDWTPRRITHAKQHQQQRTLHAF